MNTLTQQQINQYQWQAADGMAIIINPHDEAVLGLLSAENVDKWEGVDEVVQANKYFTNAPDGIYSGEAFELEDRCREPDFMFHQFLRLKPSHLPAVLTTQPGEEWKDRYKCYINKGSKLTEVHETNVDFLTKKQWYQLEWHLITPPTEQEAETAEQAANKQLSTICITDASKEAIAVDFFELGAEWQLDHLQSTLTQKDQRIAELEQMVEQLKAKLTK